MPGESGFQSMSVPFFFSERGDADSFGVMLIANHG